MLMLPLRSACMSLGASLLLTAFLPGCGGDDPVVPPSVAAPLAEPADEAALMALSTWRALPVLGTSSYRQTGSQDRLTGEPPPVALLKNGNRDMNNFVCASANATYSSNQIIPFVFDQPTCPEDYVQGVVLARIEGSGMMSRFMMTANSIRLGQVADEEILRIYVDDRTAPVVQAPLAGVIDGSAGEIFAPPFGAGHSDHIAWYYPVVFSKRLIVVLDNLGSNDLYYHQVSVVLDETPTDRHGGDVRLDARDQAAATLNATQDGPVPPLATLLDPKTVTLAPGMDTVLANLTGPATIHNLEFQVPTSSLAALANIDLQITWDQAPIVGINVPLLDLFGAALAAPEEASLALSGSSMGSDTILSLRLPMPFATAAYFIARNNSVTPVDITLSIYGEADLPADPWGHLIVQRNESVAPSMNPVHPLVSVMGRGKWAGTCMTMQGHGLGDGSGLDNPFNFLEGDELAVLDGVDASVGTGTEDYFNSSFYFEGGAKATPFAAWWGISEDGVSGQASACRFHVLSDAINFASSADVSIEIGPADAAMLERYRSVAFFYLQD